MEAMGRDLHGALHPGDEILPGYVFGGYSGGIAFYVCTSTGDVVWDLPEAGAAPLRAEPRAADASSGQHGGAAAALRVQEEEDRRLAERIQAEMDSFGLAEGNAIGMLAAVPETAESESQAVREARAREERERQAREGLMQERENLHRRLRQAEEERAALVRADQEHARGARAAQEREERERAAREALLLERETLHRRLREAEEERASLLRAEQVGQRRAADIPNEYLCPITMDVMRDPVLAMDGHTYERSAIVNWLQRSQKSPKTNCLLASKQLVPNHALKSVIADWLQRNQPPASLGGGSS